MYAKRQTLVAEEFTGCTAEMAGSAIAAAGAGGLETAVTLALSGDLHCPAGPHKQVCLESCGATSARALGAGKVAA